MTLEARIVDQVRQLLKRGCGLRQISRLLEGQVSKGSVAKIAHGTYHAHATAAGENEPEEPPQLIQKCPRCLYRVSMPCQICRARDYRHRRIQLRRKRGRQPGPD
jgi:hypothetical protein